MVKKILVIICFIVMTVNSNSYAEEVIGEVKANGMIFKDTIQIIAFDDPDITGITLYITSYNRSLSFSESGRSSISVRKVGVVSGKITSKNNIYKNSRNPFFRETIIDRFYDKKRNVLVYLSYQDSVSSEKSYHQVSVVPLNNITD